ncbi:MAG: hypothetical protein KAH20_05365 [Methylococcales bacterium]|nr:hypothetical protein [Methylococcales bacterium]
MTHIIPAQIKPGTIALMVLMAATRFHHFGNTISLPDASLAVFFLAGLWFGGILLFLSLLLEAGLIDYIAISQFSVSDFCISPAYIFLIPAYAAVWFGGYYCRVFGSQKIAHIAAQFVVLIVTVSLAYLISNGSFYLLSDKFTETSWGYYTAHFMKYYISYIQYAVLYTVSIYAFVQLIHQIKFLNSREEFPEL